MAVYVDNMRMKFGRMIMCHMIADSVEELHEMAERIGMSKNWFQPMSFPHYDVSLSRKKIALEYGAILLDRRAFTEKKKAIRARMLHEQQQHNSIPDTEQEAENA